MIFVKIQSPRFAADFGFKVYGFDSIRGNIIHGKEKDVAEDPKTLNQKLVMHTPRPLYHEKCLKNKRRQRKIREVENFTLYVHGTEKPNNTNQ